MFAIRCSLIQTNALARFSTVVQPLQVAPSVDKLRLVLTQYREKNYGQCLPSRFFKEMIRAAGVKHNGRISRSVLSRLLANIGATDSLSTVEIDEIFEAAGKVDETVSDKVIETAFVEALVLGKSLQSQLNG
ncbi:hypothetical protein FisN_23Lh079 [Fistulifera solaris]|uniref:EF-hand domain-containing protein n=1 Tax=Fistulifera solaris TaxID=1519565 RepID=A0A1Z5KM49_FISSO|nr:hypothetical protein FisN_23Lh079 [Fistulifera solaris]|eukprot:GAX27346.1 hypothetical protein FisN_23Lh079 [Fistulifera solaris]